MQQLFLCEEGLLAVVPLRLCPWFDVLRPDCLPDKCATEPTDDRGRGEPFSRRSYRLEGYMMFSTAGTANHFPVDRTQRICHGERK